MNVKHDIGQMAYVLNEMEAVQEKHPEAKVYYDYESNEIRITYPLPKDFRAFAHNIKPNL